MNNQVLLIVIAMVIVLLLMLALIILIVRKKKRQSSPAIDFDIDKLIQALGGKSNIENVDAIGSRLKVNLFDNSKVDYEQVKELGASAIIEKSDSFNFIFGQASTSIKELLEEAIK